MKKNEGNKELGMKGAESKFRKIPEVSFSLFFLGGGGTVWPPLGFLRGFGEFSDLYGRWDVRSISGMGGTDY